MPEADIREELETILLQVVMRRLDQGAEKDRPQRVHFVVSVA
jgi:hypothetical protein